MLLVSTRFVQEAEALASRREALRQAEVLFDMDVTAYPALAEVRGDRCSVPGNSRSSASGLLLLMCPPISSHGLPWHVIRPQRTPIVSISQCSFCLACLILVAQVEAELRRLGSVYSVYAEYADAVRQYSGQLWSELDIGRMVDGMQEVRKLVTLGIWR